MRIDERAVSKGAAQMIGGEHVPILSIDIEAYSSAPLPKCGVYRYADSPDFEILLFSYAFDDEAVQTIDLASGEKLPTNVLNALEDPQILKSAFNAQFERVCLSRFLGRTLDPHQWRCTKVMSSFLTLPSRLADVAIAIGASQKKMDEGKDLIRYFSMPCKPTKANSGRTRNLPIHAPDKWAIYKQYNAQDVETERAIRKQLEKYTLPEQEWELYALDQQINDRGVQVDHQLVKNAIAVDAAFSQAAYQRAKELTGLENPGSVMQLKAWLADQDAPMESLSKKLVQEKATQTEGIVAELLNLRLELSKTSVKKYEAMNRCVCSDGRIHGMMQFYGASRTGRFASRILNMQNLPQNHLPDLELARSIVKNGDEELLDALFASVPGTLSELIRTAFIPRDGCRFLVADFSAIEARVLAWLANEEWVLEEFRGKGKIYEATASRMFHIPQETIIKVNPNYEYRQKGKQATLSCIAEGQLVLTDHGLIRIENVKPHHRLWDGENWVSHEGVVYRGQKEVMTYDGLTATADHLVWIEGQARPVYFGSAAASGARLIRTEYCGRAIGMSTSRSATAQEQTGQPLGIAHRRTSRLYDIRNAGPHHRFTVSGRLVHNCGYSGGVGALKAMGAKMPEAEMQPLVDAWRAANPNIVAFWSAMDSAARRIIKHQTSVPCGRVKLYWRDGNMFMRLPSGRDLCYLAPKLAPNRFGSLGIRYSAPNASGKMVDVDTFGGKLVENCTQAVARDILANALVTLEKNNYPVVFHIHDEAVIEMPIGKGSLEEACTLMAQAPDWAEGLPLRADGFECAYYRKN